jgi:2-(1,2-epoxy-1,2-dihydrophenyl)acetyl-CoA isomerase
LTAGGRDAMESGGDTTERVLVDVSDGVATVTLNRPGKLNALDLETYRILSSLADELGEREDVRVIVLTGAGRAFCAGADLTTFADEIDFDDAHMVRDRLRFVGSVVRKWVELDRPTIAAVNGIAIGGGCNLALMCDLVLMHEDATIGQTYVQRGLVLDMGGTYFLPRLVGRAMANELALFGDAITASEAARIGLVNRCVPAAEWDATVAGWGMRLARGAGRAQRMIKTGLRASPLLDLDAVLEWEASAIAMIFQTEDLRESFAAFREKRDPVFRGR